MPRIYKLQKLDSTAPIWRHYPHVENHAYWVGENDYQEEAEAADQRACYHTNGGPLETIDLYRLYRIVCPSPITNISILTIAMDGVGEASHPDPVFPGRCFLRTAALCRE